MTTSSTATYTVEGMTCGHCRAAVLESVRKVPGVEEVDVNLESGRLEVRATQVDAGAIKTAVRDAGYEVAERP